MLSALDSAATSDLLSKNENSANHDMEALDQNDAIVIDMRILNHYFQLVLLRC